MKKQKVRRKGKGGVSIRKSKGERQWIKGIWKKGKGNETERHKNGKGEKKKEGGGKQSHCLWNTSMRVRLGQGVYDFRSHKCLGDATQPRSHTSLLSDSLAAATTSSAGTCILFDT